MLDTATLVALLQMRAHQQPDRLAYTFLADGETESALTYGQLDRRARALAARLQERLPAGERALLLYPPGLDYLEAFFGCLYAGLVAVPAYPPRRNRSAQRLQAIVGDAEVAIALTTEALFGMRVHQPIELAGLEWLATDTVATSAASEWHEPRLDCETLAFLQYTSGSTADPKGVMLTHGNLLSNLAAIQRCFADTPDDSRGLFWLPPYHDMGLIGGILEPLYVGAPVILMSPAAFLQRPLRWLEAISRYRITTSGGPNFAYDLCERKVSQEQLAALDLSCWRLAFNGAEPVRAETLERFAATFAPCGFRAEAFYPCYGLAEATLLATGGNSTVQFKTCRVEAAPLTLGQVVIAQPGAEGSRSLVGCGGAPAGQQVVIVDPVTCLPCAGGQVGEVWLSGPNIARGYFNRPEVSRETFEARLTGDAEPYLRTGDLGFLHEGELFVTGRLKDLIVIRGRNHYPQDIERTVELSHPALLAGSNAAFSIEQPSERLVVVQELVRHHREMDLEAVVSAIRQAVAREHELEVYAVVLLKTSSIPKTSSGKIQRHACRAGFLSGSLEVVDSSVLDELVVDIEAPRRSTLLELPPDERPLFLQSYLQAQLARMLKIPASRLHPDQYLNNLGLDSLMAVELKGQIEAQLEIALPMTRFLEDISVADLAAEMATGLTLPAVPVLPPSRPVREVLSPAPAITPREMSQGLQFSLFYFSSNAAEFDQGKYRLFLEGARFADDHGFSAVWTPERHFHAFGGLYPNPSVLSAALAVTTDRVRLRAGSVVLPLHNPIRVVEEWSVVDNLSHGRVDLAFATGWNANDFVLAPEHYANRRDVLFKQVETVRKLWRGEAISVADGNAQLQEVRVFPLPMQPELEIWITCSGGAERFSEAGAIGANVLTALLFQSVEELAPKIAAYRMARSAHGHDPKTGQVSLMLHTFVGEELEAVREAVRGPFTAYLESSVDLWRSMARKDPEQLSATERADLLTYAFERYFRTSALFGTPDTCWPMIERLQAIGVNEVACLIDFGVDSEAVLHNLHQLTLLKARAEHHWASVAVTEENAGQLLEDLDQLSDAQVDALLNGLLT